MEIYTILGFLHSTWKQKSHLAKQLEFKCKKITTILRGD